jgi:hypothetical protein
MIGFLLFFELKKALGSKPHGLSVYFTAKKAAGPSGGGPRLFCYGIILVCAGWAQLPVSGAPPTVGA